MRGALPWLAGGLVAGLLAFAPLRWALEQAGAARALAARDVTGSIWSGRLIDARMGGAPLGDLSARLLPAALPRGAVEARLAGAAGSGTLVLAGGATGVRALSARLDPLLAAAGAPVAQVETQALSALFRAGRCVRAGGQVTATLGPPLPTGSQLAGQARCEGEALLLPLAGPAGETLGVHVRADRSFSAELRLPGLDPAALARLGLAPAPDGAALRVEGRL
jgi:general secretion pathway protein N